MPDLGSFSPAVVIGLIAGATAMWLISGELARRAGLPLAGRVALSGALGIGVLAVATKAVIVTYLAQADLSDLARTGREMRASVATLLPSPAQVSPPTPERLQSYDWHTWRALPRTARGEATPEMVALGRALFFDTDLSVDRSLSCASCHDLARGGDDGRAVSRGVGGQTGDRNAPSVLNAAFLQRLFWDGRAPTLAAQAQGPLLNPVEMAMPDAAAVEARVAAKPAYVAAFAQVFGGEQPITMTSITRALAAYERSLITPDSPYDRFVRGDDAALSPAQLRGMALFDEIGCRNCHVDPMFSSAGTVRSMGIYRRFPVFDGNPLVARYDLLIDGRPGLWRVPSLRNVAQTAPYFHNGAVETLEEAVRIMAVSQLGRQLSDAAGDDVAIVAAMVQGEAGQTGRNLWMHRDQAISTAEIADIVAFLQALSGPVTP